MSGLIAKAVSDGTTKNCERTGVWAAFCGCTFEEGPVLREVHSKYNKNCERTGVWAAFCGCTFEEGPVYGRCTRSTTIPQCEDAVRIYLRFSYSES